MFHSLENTPGLFCASVERWKRVIRNSGRCPVSFDDGYQSILDVLRLANPEVRQRAEAMACGAIVIGSNRGGIPEVVGDAGLIVEPTGEKVAEAIKSVANMDEKQKSSFRSKTADRVKKLFTLERNILGIEEILLRK